MFGLGHGLCEMPIRYIIRITKSEVEGRSQMKIKIWSYEHIDGILKPWDLISSRKSVDRIETRMQNTPESDVEEEESHRRWEGKSKPGKYRITDTWRRKCSKKYKGSNMSSSTEQSSKLNMFWLWKQADH